MNKFLLMLSLLCMNNIHAIDFQLNDKVTICKTALNTIKFLKKEIKILVLIIASDDVPVYPELQKIWRSYMHQDPEHVEAYFIKSNPNLATACEIDGDIIWSRTEETLNPGLQNKTIQTLETLLPRIKTEFDYVLRTNLSSFYVFPRLLQFLQNQPKTRFYCGTDIGSPNIASGCGFMLSPDIVELLVRHKSSFWNNASELEDVLFGKFIRDRGYRLIPHGRMDFHVPGDWERQKNNIPQSLFHCRIKHANNLRLEHDVYTQLQLLRMFYQ